MKKISALVLVSCMISPLIADDVAQPAPAAEAPPQAAPQAEPSAPVQPNQKPVAKPKPKPKPQMATAINSFYRFARVFLMILTNQQVQSSLKGIETLLASLMQSAYQIMQQSKPANQKPQLASPAKKSTVEIDPVLVDEIARSFSSHIKKTNITRNHPGSSNSKIDDETKEILANFSGVVQNFFEILRDPENGEKVPAHILGMLGGMVNIATIAMTKHHVSPEAEYEELKAYTASLDTNLKDEMYRMIMHTQHDLVA